MPTIYRSKDKQGRPAGWTLQLELPDGRRTTARLGRMPEAAARRIRQHIADLEGCRRAGVPLPPELLAWTQGLSGPLREALERAGLIQAKPALTITQWCGQYLRARQAELKPATQQWFQRAEQLMASTWGGDTRLTDLTPLHGDQLAEAARRRWATSSANRLLGFCKQLLQAAVARKLLAENPLAHLKGLSVKGDPSRRQYVPFEVVQRVVDELGNPYLRAVVMLARLAALRIPSEIRKLTWADIIWDKRLLRVQSPKTEHHPGKAERLVPIDSRLMPYLERLFELAEPGQVAVFPVPSSYRGGVVTRMLQMAAVRAGVTLWPKRFQNLRLSCVTDWADRLPSHAVNAFAGHTEAISLQAYRKTLEHHFAIISGADPVASGGAGTGSVVAVMHSGQRGQVSEAAAVAVIPGSGGLSPVMQKAMQQRAETGYRGAQERKRVPQETPSFAANCASAPLAAEVNDRQELTAQGWRDHGTTALLFFPFWRRSRLEYRQNAVIRSIPHDAVA